MYVFSFDPLLSKPIFPNPEDIEADGLAAVGGQLTVDWLLAAYRKGVFPWFGQGDPILWWSPDPRFVLFPDQIKISKSMRPYLRKKDWSITVDKAFGRVMDACAKMPRHGQDGTWITREMYQAYSKFHKAGYAHSVEVWENDDLIGGLYGVSLGKAFFGESMFSKKSNASKLALILFSLRLQQLGFHFIDCQLHTDHLESMGAVNISRKDFLQRLEKALQYENLIGSWNGKPEFDDLQDQEHPGK